MAIGLRQDETQPQGQMSHMVSITWRADVSSTYFPADDEKLVQSGLSLEMFSLPSVDCILTCLGLDIPNNRCVQSAKRAAIYGREHETFQSPGSQEGSHAERVQPTKIHASACG